MPQMAPSWWTILFFTFTLSFMIMMFLLYSQTYNLPQSIKANKITQPKVNWKW
uniref:ATP synthase complex subunit 8 n=1 Tax=Triatoma infestans TaxID=30076 RepID=A0A343EQU3_TRIIF|nr:ATPase subunit 8 [Triatoma infestans]ASK39791.1 ATPase subunit 8 [Triatoma infestans]QKY63763.1 ATP synthase F0 subunit 8 [Triatoma infestans]UOF70708.1 ATP synthase F0 subunit 8 [Triatoma infestans]